MLYTNEGFLQITARYISEIIYGSIARILNWVIPVQKKHWIFGSDYGRSYRESSKYLLEYMLTEHKDFDCCFIADTKAVKRLLDDKGIPCVLNNSLKGVWKIACCDAVFCCQNMNDIRYAFKKKGRTYYYMTHGLPYKVCREVLHEKRQYKPSKKNKILSYSSNPQLRA